MQQPVSAPRLRDTAYRLWEAVARDMSAGELNFTTFTGASLGVQSKLRNHNLSTEELARVIGTEPLLSARVVALANSAALNASGKPVTDLRTAVLRVGHGAVWTLALSVALEQMSHSQEVAPFRDQARRIWSHSVEVAAIAHVLARHEGRVNPSDAMFAGLVHDIGYYYLMHRAARIEELAAHPGELLGLMFDWHPAVSAAVLQTLGVPEAISRAADEHELSPDLLEAGSLSHLLAVADRCAKTRNPLTPASDDTGAAQRAAEAALSEEAVRELLAEADVEVRSVLAVLRGASV